MEDSLFKLIYSAPNPSEMIIISDSLFTFADTLNIKLINSMPKSSFSWTPVFSILGIIIGAIFTIGIQVWLRKQSVQDNLDEVIASINSEYVKLKSLVRMLAMHKIHIQYWLYYFENAKKVEEKEKYFSYHVNSHKEAIETLKLIYISIGEIVQYKAKYVNIRNCEDFIIDDDIDFRKVTPYDYKLSHDTFIKKYEEDEKTLRNEYFSELDQIKNMIENMKS